MKPLIILLTTILPVMAFSQDEVYSSSKKTSLQKIKPSNTKIWTFSNGLTLAVGDTLLVGIGSQSNGAFANIQRSQTSVGKLLIKDIQKQHKAVVVKFVKREYNQSLVVPLIKIPSVSGFKWEVDVDRAIETGEIIVPEKYRPKKETSTTTIIQQPQSKADEIAKLKKLMDDGVLTKEEFELEKKKILDK